MTGFGIALVFAGIILLIAGFGQWAQNRAFENAEIIDGVVTGKRTRRLKNGTAYDLTVTYTVNGIEYNKAVGVKLTEFNTISEGDGFSLKFRPDKPNKAINPDALNPKTMRTVLISGAVIIGIGAALLLVGRLL